MSRFELLIVQLEDRTAVNMDARFLLDQARTALVREDGTYPATARERRITELNAHLPATSRFSIEIESFFGPNQHRTITITDNELRVERKDLLNQEPITTEFLTPIPEYSAREFLLEITALEIGA